MSGLRLQVLGCDNSSLAGESESLIQVGGECHGGLSSPHLIMHTHSQTPLQGGSCRGSRK